MTKTQRSIRLLKTACAILLREKKLLAFPLVSFGLGLIVMLFFVAPIALYPTGHSYTSAAHWSVIGGRISEAFTPAHNSGHPLLVGFAGGSRVIFQHGWMTLLFAVTYFLSIFLGTFCNVAFYHEIMQALNGQTVSIRRGFEFAKMRWRAILMWSVFAGLVGYIIQMIEQRIGFLGKMITGFVGFAWSVACIFIIPTLVRDRETTNPVQLLRHSAGTLKRTWGELVVGFIGFQVAMVLFVLPFFIFLFVFTVSIPSHPVLSPLVIFVPMFLLVFPLAWIKNLVNSIYRCALFIYATEGVIPEPFDKALLDSAWKVK